MARPKKGFESNTRRNVRRRQLTAQRAAALRQVTRASAAALVDARDGEAPRPTEQWPGPPPMDRLHERQRAERQYGTLAPVDETIGILSGPHGGQPAPLAPQTPEPEPEPEAEAEAQQYFCETCRGPVHQGDARCPTCDVELDWR